MNRPGLGTLWRYGRAALGNPSLAGHKLGLLSQRFRQRYIGTPKRKGAAMGLSFADGLDPLLDNIGKTFGFVVLCDDIRFAHIGLPVDDALGVLTHLTPAPMDTQFFCAGRSTDERRLRAAALDAGEVEVSFQDGTGAHNVLRIDLYEDRGNGQWVSINQRNTTARALYDWTFDTPGRIPLSQALMGPSVAEVLSARPVDLVFTWVNGADPTWQAMRAAHEPDKPSQTDNRAATRFADNGELRYALRAAAQFLPWARHIYVVSNCAPPDWLDTDYSGVSWVDHSQILPPDVLPTFNSHAIETALHKIPNLSEHFIYLNDDMFITRPLDKGWFFTASGATRARMEPYGMVTGATKDGAADYLNAARNGAALVAKYYGTGPTQLHAHVPYALRKSVLHVIETQFNDDVQQTRASRFRSGDDLSMVSFLYHHVAMAQGSCAFDATDAIMVKNSDLRWRDDLARAGQQRCDVVCLNEGGNAPPDANWTPEITRFLAKKLPCRAPWEHRTT